MTLLMHDNLKKGNTLFEKEECFLFCEDKEVGEFIAKGTGIPDDFYIIPHRSAFVKSLL